MKRLIVVAMCAISTTGCAASDGTPPEGEGPFDGGASQTSSALSSTRALQAGRMRQFGPDAADGGVANDAGGDNASPAPVLDCLSEKPEAARANVVLTVRYMLGDDSAEPPAFANPTLSRNPGVFPNCEDAREQALFFRRAFAEGRGTMTPRNDRILCGIPTKIDQIHIEGPEGTLPQSRGDGTWDRWDRFRNGMYFCFGTDTEIFSAGLTRDPDDTTKSRGFSLQCTTPDDCVEIVDVYIDPEPAQGTNVVLRASVSTASATEPSQPVNTDNVIPFPTAIGPCPPDLPPEGASCVPLDEYRFDGPQPAKGAITQTEGGLCACL